MATLDASVIRELVAPVVMISACGLLCLSTNARMQAVIGRLRAMHNERVKSWVDDPGEHDRAKRARDMRLEGIASQTTHMLRRLRAMRNTLILLFTAILMMLISSAGIGLSSLIPGGAAVAIGAFVLGGLAMSAAMAVSIYEVGIGLRALRYEHDRVLALDAEA